MAMQVIHDNGSKEPLTLYPKYCLSLIFSPREAQWMEPTQWMEKGAGRGHRGEIRHPQTLCMRTLQCVTRQHSLEQVDKYDIKFIYVHYKLHKLWVPPVWLCRIRALLV